MFHLKLAFYKNALDAVSDFVLQFPAKNIMTTGLASSGNNNNVRLTILVAATAAVVIFVAIAIYGPSIITHQNFCIEQHIEPPLNALVFLLSFALEKTIFAY